MPRGGYRRPSNPAPVSGPGKLSRRTDGGPMQGPKVASGGKYGERKAMQEMQSAAPMAATQRQPDKVALPQITSLTAPTTRPNEPVTAGSPMGPGPGPEALAPVETGKLTDVLAKIVDYDPTGEVADLYDYLLTRGL